MNNNDEQINDKGGIIQKLLNENKITEDEADKLKCALYDNSNTFNEIFY